MAASFGALRHDDVGAGIEGTFGAVDILYLADKRDARRLDARGEGLLIAERQEEGLWRALHCLLEEFRKQSERPGYITNADLRIAGGAKLLLHPGFAAIAGFRIAIAAAD